MTTTQAASRRNACSTGSAIIALKRWLWQGLAVDVRHVGAQHERGLVLAWQRLQMSRLADGQLDGVWRARDDGLNGGGHIFDASQEARLIEEAVVDGDIEAIAVGAEEPVQSWGHRHTGMFLSGPHTMRSSKCVVGASVFRLERRRRLPL